MVKRLIVSVVASLGVALCALVAGEAHAGSLSPCSGPVAVYSVKFTCGYQQGSDDDVVTGVYRTNINIHNPQSSTVNFCTQVVLPDNASPTGASSLVPQTLSADHSLFVDCYTTDVYSISSQLTASSITAPATEFEGFVEIVVPQTNFVVPSTLDVEGKYTARSGGFQYDHSQDVSSLQVVVYQPTFTRH